MNKQALIVGASGGIGRAIAARLAGEGWRILAHGRNSEELGKTLEAVREAGSDGASFEADLTDTEQLAGLAEWACDSGRLDALIWSAGGGRSVDSGPDALPEWDRTLTTSLHAPMQMTAWTLPTIRATQGAYLYICGIYAKVGMAKMAAHCAARHGLEGFAKALFEEVREDGVRVTLLHPGFVYSQLVDTERLDPARMIQVSDIADVAALALTIPAHACVVETTVRPQRSPYKTS